jgi:hypothetical protein
VRESSRVIVIAAVALASAASLQGCTQAPAERHAGHASSTSEAQPAKVTSTIYFVSGKDGKKKYLTAGDPLVVAVTDVVNRQAEATDNRDVKGIDFPAEYRYYTTGFTARVKKGQNSESKFYQKYQLATKHIGIYWFEMNFDPSLKKTTVKMMDQFVYSKASAAYYAKTKLSPTTVVAQQRAYSLSLVGGTWTITDIEASNEVTQPKAQPALAGH